jgi:hypothetical protein
MRFIIKQLNHRDLNISLSLDDPAQETAFTEYTGEVTPNIL